MPRYCYEAVTVGGELVQGEMEASDRAAVIARLQEAGSVPIRASPADGGALAALWTRRRAGARRIGRRDLAAFTQELSSLLHAGLPLDRALAIMIDAAGDGAPRELAADIQQAVRGGAALSDALAAHPRTFSRFYVSMVRAAEAAGRLDQGLASLLHYLERSRALRESVVSALIYPAILVTVAGVSLLIILTYVVPQFTQLFADAGRALPLPTRIVIGAAEWLRSYGGLLVVAMAVLAVVIRRRLRRPAGRYRWDRMVLQAPVVGDLITKMEMARFSRSLGTLLASGVPLLAGLGIVKEILGNRVLAETLEPAAETLKAGRSLVEPLMSTGLFPALGLQMIRVGEETGRLDDMLLRIADLYDGEVASATQRLLALLEPVLIVGLGVVIAGVIMSILVAIVSVNELPL
ncbi:general secretion pathway protein F [Sulfurifustis variabilis]|uniref:General secretion pathway protein F n=1 Tax=Sulfurifustis variabilis TaxID=1675686 RepID=A0A1C7AFG9_9GAMM|nr:type II secretion system F family protein [Sulfurifustis variabilis]BAU50066.1 general secretion pathway protein F [Sulfurifustis variabilis]